jgi:hypothetical protein
MTDKLSHRHQMVRKKDSGRKLIAMIGKREDGSDKTDEELGPRNLAGLSRVQAIRGRGHRR